MQDFTLVELAAAYNIVGMNFIPRQAPGKGQKKPVKFNECDRITQDARVLWGACALLRSPSETPYGGTAPNKLVLCGRRSGDAGGCGVIIEASGVLFRVQK